MFCFVIGWCYTWMPCCCLKPPDHCPEIHMLMFVMFGHRCWFINWLCVNEPTVLSPAVHMLLLDFIEINYLLLFWTSWICL
jgi:hypothetical protein